MNTDDFKQALELANDEDKARLLILKKAAVENLKKVKDNATTTALNSLKAADRALEEEVSRIKEKYGARDGLVLENANQVYEWLKRNGFKCSRPTINRHCKNGKIPAAPEGFFMVTDVASYAEENLHRDESAPLPPGSPGQSAEITFEPGLDHALTRLRAAEVETFRRWMEALEAGKGADMLFKAWQAALDLLRKAEGNLTEHLTARRDLIPAGEVKNWLAGMIESTKAALTDLPAKSAPELEGLPWPEIQKRLTEEVRDALRRLQDFAQ